MYCQKCGLKLPEGISECDICGHPVSRPWNRNNPQSPRPSSWFGPFLIVIVLGIIFWGLRTDDPVDPGQAAVIESIEEIPAGGPIPPHHLFH